MTWRVIRMQQQYQLMEEKLISQFKQQINAFVKSTNSGVLAQMLQHHFKAQGKLIRPRLVFRLATTFGLPAEKVQGWAMACELLHNATLIHDDLQDGDRVRRGHATVWDKFGANMAINAGDQLLLLAPSAIQSVQASDEIKLKLFQNFTKMSTAIVDGQCREFELNHLNSESLYQDYLECIKGKTAALFSYLAIGVGEVAGIEKDKLEQLHRVFEQLGIIFQIQDDLLDLFGEKQRDAVGCDVKEGKVSYLVVKHLELNPSDKDQIQTLLQRPRELTTDEDVSWFKNLLIESKSYEICMNEFHDMTESLLKNKILLEEQKIMSVVKQILEQVLVPIAHLLKQPLGQETDPVQEVRYASAIN